MRLHTIHDEIAAYAETLHSFISEHELPAELFDNADHLAVKCAGTDDYNHTVETVKALEPRAFYEEIVDGRRLASVALSDPIYLGHGLFEWLEMMEPRPGVVVARGFVEHTEYVEPRFGLLRSIMMQHGVPTAYRQSNPAHSTLTVPIGDDREIKFNNRALKDIVAASEGASLEVVGE